jgi:ferric-dicitrate binding protein FerR (iron transport regulator)
MTRISTLIIKQLKGEITPKERMELDLYAAQSENNRRLVEDYTRYKHVLGEVSLSNELCNEDDWRKIEMGLPGKVVRITRYHVAVAAAVLTILGGWFLWEKKRGKTAPVVKVDNRPSGSGMNTMETGKGESTVLRLADGSSVWLNSASSVQYPGGFSGAERAITLLAGEVHCEIIKDPVKPFKVHIGGVEVEVKGTKFDISAYKNDSVVRTTLIEGEVKVKAGKDTLSLHPGEQAVWASGKKLKKIKVDSAGARYEGWKENKFKWVHTDLRTLLEDLSHWYGCSLKYKIDVPLKPYTITIDRSEPLANVLKILHKVTELNLKLEGTTIVVN